MPRYISYPLFPRFYSENENGEEGYLEIPLKTINQLGIRYRLVNGSKKNNYHLFIRSGDDLRFFANELLSRTGLQLVNGRTHNAVVSGEHKVTKTIAFCLNHSPAMTESIGKLPNAAKPRKAYKPGGKLPLPKNLVFRFYSDPGHGWLAVKMNLLYALGIQEQISECSYRSGDTAYLEEDSDLSTFANAMAERGIPWTEIDPKIKYKHLNDSSNGSYIRRKQHYFP